MIPILGRERTRNSISAVKYFRGHQNDAERRCTRNRWESPVRPLMRSDSYRRVAVVLLRQRKYRKLSFLLFLFPFLHKKVTNKSLLERNPTNKKNDNAGGETTCCLLSFFS